MLFHQHCATRHGERCREIAQTVVGKTDWTAQLGQAVHCPKIHIARSRRIGRYAMQQCNLGAARAAQYPQSLLDILDTGHSS